MSDRPPAGWNTDPDDPSQYRYWDGDNWTEHRAPKDLEKPPPPGGAPSPGQGPDAAEEKRKAALGFVIIGVIVVVALAMCGGEDEDASPAAAPTEAATALAEEAATGTPTELSEVEPTEVLTPPETQSVENVSVLAMSPGEFASRWDQAAAEFDMGQLAIGALDVSDGDAQNVFQEMLADNLVLMGTVLHSGELRDVLLMAQASTDDSENLQVIASWGILIASLSPELSTDERGEVLEELGVFGDRWTEDGYEATATRGDVRYQLTYSEMIGWMFTGAPADS